MALEKHFCHKCGKEIKTFFAHQIPVGDGSDQYTIEPEWICTSCMCELMYNRIIELIGVKSSLDWFPLQKRISLEYEDEEFGSFSIRVWHAEAFETCSYGRLVKPSEHEVFIFEAANLTYDESIHYSFQLPGSMLPIPQLIHDGMLNSIGALYTHLRVIKASKKAQSMI